MKRPRWKPTAYQRIVRAAKARRGVRLSARDAVLMGLFDDAVMEAALQDDESQNRWRKEKGLTQKQVLGGA